MSPNTMTLAPAEQPQVDVQTRPTGISVELIQRVGADVAALRDPAKVPLFEAATEEVHAILASSDHDREVAELAKASEDRASRFAQLYAALEQPVSTDAAGMTRKAEALVDLDDHRVPETDSALAEARSALAAVKQPSQTESQPAQTEAEMIADTLTALKDHADDADAKFADLIAPYVDHEQTAAHASDEAGTADQGEQIATVAATLEATPPPSAYEASTMVLPDEEPVESPGVVDAVQDAALAKLYTKEVDGADDVIDEQLARDNAPDEPIVESDYLSELDQDAQIPRHAPRMTRKEKIKDAIQAVNPFSKKRNYIPLHANGYDSLQSLDRFKSDRRQAYRAEKDRKQHEFLTDQRRWPRAIRMASRLAIGAVIPGAGLGIVAYNVNDVMSDVNNRPTLATAVSEAMTPLSPNATQEDIVNRLNTFARARDAQSKVDYNGPQLVAEAHSEDPDTGAEIQTFTNMQTGDTLQVADATVAGTTERVQTYRIETGQGGQSQAVMVSTSSQQTPVSVDPNGPANVSPAAAAMIASLTATDDEDK